MEGSGGCGEGPEWSIEVLTKLDCETKNDDFSFKNFSYFGVPNSEIY